MSAESNRVGTGPLAVAWAVTAAAFVVRTQLTAASVPLILDTDDAMRLTDVHDLLAGQGWFDIVQHRINTPFGAEIHWSRLVDLPEAVLLRALRLLADGAADTILAYIWPLGLLAILLWLTGKLAVRLGGREALWPAVLLPAFSLITMGEFVPGRLDHHSAQILLTLALVYCLVAALTRPRFAIGAGIAAAAAITIGIEGLPMVAAAVVVLALAWVVEPKHAAALRDFGLSFACATALGVAIDVPPDHWLAIRVDAISLVYVLAAVLCAVAFAALSMVAARSLRPRFLAAIVAGAAVAAILLAIDPAILKGPYAALDPWLLQNWLPRISEAESWLQSAASDPVYPVAVTVPVLVALIFALWNGVRHATDRAAWLVYAALLAAGILVMIVQIRAARIVTPLSVPGDAALVAAAWRLSRRQPGFRPALAVIGCVLASMGIFAALVVALIPLPPGASETGAANPRNACLDPQAFAALAQMPPQRLMAPIDLGSHLLLFTPHSVVGASFHRNEQGVLDTFRFFNEAIEQARTILDARGISRVVICPAMREIRGLVAHTPDSFVSLYAEDKLPAWLVDETAADAPLQVYRVAR